MIFIRSRNKVPIRLEPEHIDHIVNSHPELIDQIDKIVDTIQDPDQIQTEDIMEPLKIFERNPKVNLRYDAGADVLYISFPYPKSALGIDIGEGMILRFDEKKKQVVGLTIYGIRGKLVDYLKQKAA